MNRKRYDLLLIGAVLVIALIMFIVYKFNQIDGSKVEVVVNDKVVETFNLNQDVKKEIKTENGINILEIKNSVAKITHANCPDKLCVYQKAISKSGESIICIPHKLIIKIVGNSKNSDLDSIAN